MNAEQLLGLVGQAFALYAQIRANAKAAGISDEQLDAVTADYKRREDRRDGEIAAGTVSETD
jgi:hypothetical protein